MKSLILLAAMALSAAATADARLAPVPRPPEAVPMPPPATRAPPHGAPGVPSNCALTIGFQSYGAGIDQGARANIERVLNNDRGVRNWTRHPWGREGEVTLCVLTRTNGDAVRLSRRVRTLIPARPRGPIRIELPFMRRY